MKLPPKGMQSDKLLQAYLLNTQVLSLPLPTHETTGSRGEKLFMRSES